MTPGPEAFNRPLFDEPTKDAERTDAWNGPKGFMIGGMALPTTEDLSRQYYEAAALLIGAIKRDDVEDYKLVNPVLFLFRHSMELLLKSFLGISKTHDLTVLTNSFEAAVRAKHFRDLPEWVHLRMGEISRVDPGSTAFRYGEIYDAALKRHVPVDGDVYVSLRHLESSMGALRSSLKSIWNFGVVRDCGGTTGIPELDALQ